VSAVVSADGTLVLALSWEDIVRLQWLLPTATRTLLAVVRSNLLRYSEARYPEEPTLNPKNQNPKP
jgi:hypothetical protein